MRTIKIAIATATVLLITTSTLAQNSKSLPRDEQNKYVISARAGVVNIVQGEASVRSDKPDATADMLISADQLRIGDDVKTGATGRVEVLLNPGCFLRLGANGEFGFLFDGYLANKIKLVRGSSVIEASVIDGPILIETPKTTFNIVRNGLYRFNVSSDGRAEVAVRKGRALAGDTLIKDGRRATVENGATTLAKMDKKDVDDLDDWSKLRAQSLIAANKQLSTSAMRRTFGIALLHNTWIYDPFCRCYTFLPFTSGFNSPYGWSYSVCNPYWYYAPLGYNGGSGGYVGSKPSNGGGSGTGGGSGSGGGSGGSGGHHHATPPMSINPGGGHGSFTPPSASPSSGGATGGATPSHGSHKQN